jgi:predicted Zn-dependent peptidase
MKAQKTTLANGLRVLTIPMPSLESITSTIWVGTGSRYETPKINGISHFMEHMAFKGGKKYPSAQIVAETVDGLGGEFNAATDKELTNFYIRSSAQAIDKAFDVLADMVLSPLLKAEDINREKGVILEEIGMYDDTPAARVWDIFERLIFQGTNLAMDVLGTRKTVSALTKTDFDLYRKTYYYPENMLIVVAGGINHQEVLKLSKKYFAKLKSRGALKRKLDFTWQQNQRHSFKSKKTEQTNLVIGFPGNPLGQKDRYIEAVLEVILGGGMSSRLFREVREKRGLAYSVHTSVNHSLDTGYFSAYAGVDPKKALEALKVIIAEFAKIGSTKHAITKKELAKAKEYLKGHFALSLENTKAVNSFFAFEELLLAKTRTPDEVFAGVNAVNLEEASALAKKIFDLARLRLAVIGPNKNFSKFENLLKNH